MKAALLFCLVFSLQPSAQAAVPADFLYDLEAIRQKSVVVRSAREQNEADGAASLNRLLQLTPSVSAGVGKSETRVNSDFTGKGKSIYDYWRVSADWNLFHGLGDALAWKAARGVQEASRFQVHSQELKAELDGARVIFNRLYYREAKQAQDELVALKKEAMRLGRDRYKQGKIPLQEVSKMEVDLSLQLNQARAAEVDLAQNEAAWKGFFIDELKTRDWPLSEAQGLALSEGSGSPSVKRLRTRAGAFLDSWKASRTRHLPSLDLAVSYREAPVRSPHASTWAGTLELSLPLWSRYELASASAQSYASFLEAEGDAEAAEREEALRRDFLKKKITLSYASIKEARLNQEKSEKLYRDMLRSFQLGRLSTNELFQEQDRKVRSLLSYSAARLAFHESLMEACALWGLSAKACLK